MGNSLGKQNGRVTETSQRLERLWGKPTTPPLFGISLTDIMALQGIRSPNRQLPWPVVELCKQVLKQKGLTTEGIFRRPTDVDDVNRHKQQMDAWWENGLICEPSNAHVAAGLLKLWLRKLDEPLIPNNLYYRCVTEPMTIHLATDTLLRMPVLNKLVLCYLIRFLQSFNKPEVIAHTKMCASNLALVFALNCFRNMDTDPSYVFDNLRKEATFFRCLILELDTECVRDII